MSWRYFCPHCGAHLNPGGEWIALLGRFGRHQALFYFYPKPGDHSHHIADPEKPEKGEMVEFHCPICHASLSFKKDPHYAGLRMVDAEGKNHAVFFSKVTGEKKTVAGELADQ